MYSFSFDDGDEFAFTQDEYNQVKHDQSKYAELKRKAKARKQAEREEERRLRFQNGEQREEFHQQYQETKERLEREKPKDEAKTPYDKIIGQLEDGSYDFSMDEATRRHRLKVYKGYRDNLLKRQAEEKRQAAEKEARDKDEQVQAMKATYEQLSTDANTPPEIREKLGVLKAFADSGSPDGFNVILDGCKMKTKQRLNASFAKEQSVSQGAQARLAQLKEEIAKLDNPSQPNEESN